MKDIQLRSSTMVLKIIFVISAAIIFFIAGITYKHITVLRKSANWVEQSHDVTMELEKLLSYLKDAETGQRGYLLTKNKAFLAPYLKSRTLIKQSFDKVSDLTSNSRTQQANLKKLQYFIDKRQHYLSKTLIISEQNNYDKKILEENLVIGKNTMDSVRKRVETMLATQKFLLENRQRDYQSTMSYTPLLIYLTLLVTLILITISFIKMNRALVKLRKSINTLSVANEASNLAEAVGGFGSWQYNIETQEYTFSDNEYRLLGVEPQAFKAGLEEFYKYVHPEDVESVKEHAQNIPVSDELKPFTYRIIRADGALRYFRALGRVVTVASGERTHIGTTSDVTEEVKASRFTEERNRELENNNKELTAFNYIASHDLQEPLRKIETFLSRLVSKDYNNLSSSGQQYITSIQTSAHRMRILIEDLLQFSRTNKTEKIFEVSDLNILLDNAKQELVQIIEDKKAKIEYGKLPTLKVIPFQIQQLFTNLIGNSLKYSKADVAPIIKISCQIVSSREDSILPKDNIKYYKITVEDNGIGFEQEYVTKIFVLFSRLHNKTDYAGTGIGLAICKKIVENHQGFIYANGELDKGSTFSVYLPSEL